MMLTDRQYTCASYHLQSAQHYADTKDWEKLLAHVHAAELIITSDISEYKQYVKFCLNSKITKYDWTREVKQRNG